GTYPSLQPFEFDRKVIDVLDDITGKDETSFTWVNKWGSHFTYDTTYPPDHQIFSPVYKDSSADNAEAMHNSYYNSLRWAVDDFFATLLKRIEGRDVVIVYTSDHGQSLLEAGIPGTHNRTYNISSSQANVPLLLFGTNDQQRSDLKKIFISENRDRV